MSRIEYTLDGDNLLTASRRVVRCIRIDEAGGGLTSEETIKACEHLAKHIEIETKRIKNVTREVVILNTIIEDVGILETVEQIRQFLDILGRRLWLRTPVDSFRPGDRVKITITKEPINDPTSA